MIIIIGSSEESHSRFIYNKLNERNIPVLYYDTRDFPIISWSPGIYENYLILDNKKIYLSDVTGIYWRWHYGYEYKISDIVYRERISAIENILKSFSDICFNPFDSIELHKRKGYQLQLLNNNNIKIPKTLITNDAEALINFYQENGKNVIYKPVRGGAYTKKLTMEDMKKLNTLKNCPIQLQEYIEGTDIRVYAFESGEIFAGEIHTDSTDFRSDTNAKINPVNIPEHVKTDCLKVLKILGLKYSGIDIRRNNFNEYVFIEANPAPMFTYFEEVTHLPISDTLIKNLCIGRQ